MFSVNVLIKSPRTLFAHPEAVVVLPVPLDANEEAHADLQLRMMDPTRSHGYDHATMHGSSLREAALFPMFKPSILTASSVFVLCLDSSLSNRIASIHKNSRAREKIDIDTSSTRR